MIRKFLEDVYDRDASKTVDAFYDEWSASYDKELVDNSYSTPQRLAEALTKLETPTDERLLDYGCGTGLSGQALVAQGFTLLDGCDLSTGMLAEAEHKQIYGRLWQAEEDPLHPVSFGSYAIIVAAGVVSPGAAPAHLLHRLAAALDEGGRIAFSFNDHALHDPTYIDALRELRENGMTLAFEEYGEHLPGIGLNSTVYVFDRV
ncbi:MAG: methyltransferase domain-containing protein [Pseudomonadota bacterium]